MLLPLLLLFPLSTALATGAAAQTAVVAETGPKLTAWPAVPADKAEALAADVQRLRKAHTPEMGKQAHDALTAIGAAAVPSLLPALEKEVNEAARERVRALLVELIAPEHTRLLAKEFTSKLPAVREFALLRAAAFPDAGLREDAEKALAFTKPDPKKKIKPPPLAPDEAYAAALCCASSGSIAGLFELHERATKQWAPRRAELTTALNAARGKPASEFLLPLLEHEDRAKRVAAINMLGACGDKETAVPRIKPFLDDVDGGLKISAINALRGIVDNAPPIDNLSIFEAVEEAKKWQKRV
ncbi:MAG: hypothetical protein FJ299_01375 [Planctomycetes bacterium]|nr:hypothetical protein [Planctomycetota bacterium]